MTETPFVSVIVPVYNVYPYLKESLDSLINQTYRNIEILLIDDGSTDGSGEICDEYQKIDNRIRVVHQENRGLSAARNVGLDMMKGKLVAFLDPDDAFRPEMIRILTDAIERYHAEMATCDFQVVKTTGSLIAEQKPLKNLVSSHKKEEILTSSEALQELIAARFPIVVWATISQKVLWDRLRFLEGRVYEDMQVTWLLLERAERIVWLHEVLVMHRKHLGSITSDRSVQNVRDWIYATRIMENYVEGHTIFSEEQKDLFFEKNFRQAVLRCSEMMLHDSQNDRDFSLSFRKEIIQRRKAYGKRFHTLKISAAYFLFKYVPFLLPFVRKSYRFCKRFFENV